MSVKYLVLPSVLVGAVILMAPPRISAQTSSASRQSVSGGGVMVDVTFLTEPADTPKFRISLDTHSVNLDGYDFKEIVRLRDATGNELAPTAVEGAEGAGHHRSATVQFARQEPKPQVLELVVKGVAGVPERVYRWTVE